MTAIAVFIECLKNMTRIISKTVKTKIVIATP